MIYLDYNATAPILPHVEEIVHSLQSQLFGNPSSPHQIGQIARDELEKARKQIADLLQVDKRDLSFTSGGSEGNNTIVRSVLFSTSPQHIITSQIEHPSIFETCQQLQTLPHIQVSYLPVNAEGVVLPETLASAITPETTLITIMSANNETGVIQPIAELSKVAQKHSIPFHTDAVQAVGKLELALEEWGIQYATIAAHKFGGPKGIGVLYVKQGAPFSSLISGGKQERVRRAGTENVALACGMSSAMQWAFAHKETLNQKYAQWKSTLFEHLKTIPGFFLNGNLANTMSHTFNFGIVGIHAESLLIALDLEGICVSTGSACSSGALEASPVLLAMGLNKADAKSCLRISFGYQTTSEEINLLVERLKAHIHRLLN